MKKGFKQYLLETEFSGTLPSFYNLYYVDYKPYGEDKEEKELSKEEKEKKENDYKELLTHFLRTTSAIN